MKLFLFTIVFGMVLCAEMIRDAERDIVIDAKTGLMWQDDLRVSSETYAWEQAIGFCELGIGPDGSFANYDDWRLPNINELLTLVDDAKTSGVRIKSPFQNTYNGSYWSATTTMASQPLHIRFNNASSSSNVVSTLYYVRCVRGGQ